MKNTIDFLHAEIQKKENNIQNQVELNSGLLRQIQVLNQQFYEREGTVKHVIDNYEK